MISLKAITIQQPWATLIAIGEKTFETRTWATKHEGILAIHAGKTIDKEAYKKHAEVLARHGYPTKDSLPVGAVIATTFIGTQHKVVSEDKGNSAVTDQGLTIEGSEYQYGYYDVGNFAWKLDSVKKFAEPIPSKGQLGLWNFNGGE